MPSDPTPTTPSILASASTSTGNASRQYSAPRNLGLILKPLLWIPEYELQTGGESHRQSRLDLDKTPDEDRGPPSPDTQTNDRIQEPVCKQGDQVVPPNQQTGGALPLKHATTRER